jgi:hypothetical protein
MNGTTDKCQHCSRDQTDLNLSCGHLIHVFCLRKRLKSKEWKTGEIVSFDYLRCSECKLPFAVSDKSQCPQPVLDLLREEVMVYDMVKMTAEEKVPGEAKDQGNPVDLCIFVLCEICKEPFFHGLKAEANGGVIESTCEGCKATYEPDVSKQKCQHVWRKGLVICDLCGAQGDISQIPPSEWSETSSTGPRGVHNAHKEINHKSKRSNSKKR